MDETEISQAWAFVAPYWPESVWLESLLVLGLGICMAMLSILFLRLVVGRLAGKTKTTFDDRLVAAIEKPLFYSIIVGSFWVSVKIIEFPPPLPYLIRGCLFSLVVAFWTWTARAISEDMIEGSLNANSLVKPRTLPILKMAAMILTYGGGLYLLFLAWDFDLTAWVASAGIAGVAVGFAAQDTLANLFAGISIIVDAPYKLGDVIVLDGTRGRVVQIGMRSTRIVTLDNVEIVIPNATMATADLTNESGGPILGTRVSTTVEAAYGSDVDQVRSVLQTIGDTIPGTLPRPADVHFTAFGASGLEFKLRVWIGDPEQRPAILDQLNESIYKRFAEESIEIPYQTVDVNILRS